MYAVQWKYWYYQPLMLKRRCKRDPKEQEMSLNGWQNPGCNQGWEGGGEPVNHNLVSIWLKSGCCKKVHKWQCKSALMKDHGFHQSSEGGWWRGVQEGGEGDFMLSLTTNVTADTPPSFLSISCSPVTNHLSSNEIFPSLYLFPSVVLNDVGWTIFPIFTSTQFPPHVSQGHLELPNNAVSIGDHQSQINRLLQTHYHQL